MIRTALLFVLMTGLAFAQEDVFEHPVKTADSPPLQEIGERLQQITVLRASFTQKKQIKALKRPLKSKGTFLFGAEQGLTWQVTRPFPTTFIVSLEGIMQHTQGQEPIKIEAEERPVISSFTKMFLLLFRGDTKVMEERFKLHFTGNAQHWQIGLKPKGMMLKKVIDHIILKGDVHMSQLELVEATGDRTLIEFHEVTTEPALTEEELARFAF